MALDNTSLEVKDFLMSAGCVVFAQQDLREEAIAKPEASFFRMVHWYGIVLFGSFVFALIHDRVADEFL